MAAEKGTVRVRFSPSPTGPLHVGAARTALMNWLFARHAAPWNAEAWAQVASGGSAPLEALDARLAACRTIGRDEAAKMLAKVRDTMNDLPAKTVMRGLRAALTGRSVGLRLAEVMWVLDVDACRGRLASARRCIC